MLKITVNGRPIAFARVCLGGHYRVHPAEGREIMEHQYMDRNRQQFAILIRMFREANLGPVEIRLA